VVGSSGGGWEAPAYSLGGYSRGRAARLNAGRRPAASMVQLNNFSPPPPPWSDSGRKVG
jgi:hypothetical protein